MSILVYMQAHMCQYVSDRLKWGEKPHRREPAVRPELSMGQDVFLISLHILSTDRLLQAPNITQLRRIPF